MRLALFPPWIQYSWNAAGFFSKAIVTWYHQEALNGVVALTGGGMFAIGYTGGVFQVPIRRHARGIPLGSLAQIGDICQRIEDVPTLGIDLVNSEVRVQITVRGDGRARSKGSKWRTASSLLPNHSTTQTRRSACECQREKEAQNAP